MDRVITIPTEWFDAGVFARIGTTNSMVFLALLRSEFHNSPHLGYGVDFDPRCEFVAGPINEIDLAASLGTTKETVRRSLLDLEKAGFLLVIKPDICAPEFYQLATVENGQVRFFAVSPPSVREELKRAEMSNRADLVRTFGETAARQLFGGTKSLRVFLGEEPTPQEL